MVTRVKWTTPGVGANPQSRRIACTFDAEVMEWLTEQARKEECSTAEVIRTAVYWYRVLPE